MSRIIFPTENGVLCTLYPSGDLPVAEVAKKDVPAGTPYLIVEDDVIPSDRTFANAWEADFSNPDGYGIGADAWFAAKAAAEAGEQIIDVEVSA